MLLTPMVERDSKQLFFFFFNSKYLFLLTGPNIALVWTLPGW